VVRSFADGSLPVPPRSKRFSTDAAPGGSSLIIRNVTVLGKRTSLRMEPEIWEALADVCKRENVHRDHICSLVAERKAPESSLTGALRVFLLAYFRAASALVPPPLWSSSGGAESGEMMSRALDATRWASQDPARPPRRGVASRRATAPQPSPADP